MDISTDRENEKIQKDCSMKKVIKKVTNSPPLYWFIYGRIARHIENLNKSPKTTQ